MVMMLVYRALILPCNVVLIMLLLMLQLQKVHVFQRKDLLLLSIRFLLLKRLLTSVQKRFYLVLVKSIDL